MVVDITHANMAVSNVYSTTIANYDFRTHPRGYVNRKGISETIGADIFELTTHQSVSAVIFRFFTPSRRPNLVTGLVMNTSNAIIDGVTTETMDIVKTVVYNFSQVVAPFTTMRFRLDGTEPISSMTMDIMVVY